MDDKPKTERFGDRRQKDNTEYQGDERRKGERRKPASDAKG